MWIMFDRAVVMKDQRSVSVFLLDPPSEGFLFGTECKSDPGECVSKYTVSQHFSGSYSFPAHVHLLNSKAVQCVEASRPEHHGGAGLLPSSGTDVFFWSHESHAGRPSGAR